jgi:hypothetical protein
VVGRFGRAGSDAAEMVLKGPSGFAFVGANKERGILEAKTVVPYGTRLEGDGLPYSWLVGPDDKVIGLGRLNGRTDCLVVVSGWGVSVWTLDMITGTPKLVSIHPNGTEFGDSKVGTWRLDTTDPRFRLLSVGDIDADTDSREEMVLMSSSGLAILHENGLGGLDLRFFRSDGGPVSTDAIATTADRLVYMADFNDLGGRRPALPA